MTIQEGVPRLRQIGEDLRGASKLERPKIYETSAEPLLADLRQANDEKYNGDGYIKEKLTSAEWHLKTLAGLDDGNNHDEEQHFVWLLGCISSITQHVNAIDREREKASNEEE